MKGSSLLAFGEKRRKTEVSTPLLYYRAKRVWKGRRFGGLSAAESVNLPVPLCPLRQVFRHRSVSGDVECLAGRLRSTNLLRWLDCGDCRNKDQFDIGHNVHES